MLTELKKHFDAVKAGTEKLLTENAPEGVNSEPSAIPVPGSTSNATEAAPVSVEKLKQKENVEVTQHLLKVYPVNFGSTYYKGVKFSVTLCSADATWADAVTLMDEFIAHKECIAPDCFVQVSNVPPMPQPATTAPVLPQSAPPAAAPPTRNEADGKGRKP